MNNVQKNFKAKSQLRDRLVRGEGGPKDDKVKIAASDGEYVLPTEVVEHVGKENLDRMVEGITGRAPVPGKKDGLRAYAFGGGIEVGYPEEVTMRGDNVVRQPPAAPKRPGSYVGQDFAPAARATTGLRGVANTVGKFAGPLAVATTGAQAINDVASTDTEDYATRFGIQPRNDGTILGDLLPNIGLRTLGAASDLGNALTFGLAGNFFRDKQAPETAVPNAGPATPSVSDITKRAFEASRVGNGYAANPMDDKGNGLDGKPWSPQSDMLAKGEALRAGSIPGVFEGRGTQGERLFTDGRDYRGPTVMGADIETYRKNTAALRDLQNFRIKEMDGRTPEENLALRAQSVERDRFNAAADQAVARLNPNTRSGRAGIAEIETARLRGMSDADKTKGNALRDQLALSADARDNARLQLDLAKFGAEQQKTVAAGAAATDKIATEKQAAGAKFFNDSVSQLFQTTDADGKIVPNAVAQEQLKQFIMTSEPRFKDGKTSLYDLGPAEQSELLAKYVPMFRNQVLAMNKLQDQNDFGGFTSERYTGPMTFRAPTLADVFARGGIEATDYARAKVSPWTRNEVGVLPDGRRALSTDLAKESGMSVEDLYSYNGGRRPSLRD